MKKAKQILSVLLAVVMTVAVVPVMEAGAASFTPRMTAPERTGYYGTQNSYNPFRTNSDAGNGNCTWYAWGRAYELLGSRPQLSTGNASTWYPTNQNNGNYPYGSTPKLGAIACWSGGSTGAGHVAVVEQINDNGSFVISESSWSAQTWWFRTTTLNASGYYSSGLSFQGFIYIGNFSDNTPTFNPIIYDNKNAAVVNEEISFWYSGLRECSKVEFCFEKNGEVYYRADSTSSTTYNTYFEQSGTYYVYVRGLYNGEWYYSSKTKVTVLNPVISDNKNTACVGESISFTYSGLSLCSEVQFEFSKNGTVYYSPDSTSSTTFSTYFENPGTYYVNAAGYLDGNWCRSEKVKVEIVNHSFGAWTKINDTQHQRVCSRDSSHVEKANHTWNSGTVTNAATCTATGVKSYTCSVCNGSKTETISKNPNNHVNTKNVAAVASTCTVKGYSAGVYCNDCKKYISGHVEQTLNSNNHVNTKNVAAVASTCTVKGYSAGVYCNDCKKYISGHAEQPLAAHQTTVINAREATYDAEGYTGDTYCTACRQTLSYGTTIPKLTKPEDPTNPTNPTNPTQPTQPATQPTTQQQQQQSGACKYCGGTHTGFPGVLIGFFHSILALFGLRK